MERGRNQTVEPGRNWQLELSELNTLTMTYCIRSIIYKKRLVIFCVILPSENTKHKKGNISVVSTHRFLFSASRSKSCGRTGLPSVNLSCFHCFGLPRPLGAAAAAGGDDGGVCGEPLLPRCLDFCLSSAIWSERMRFSGILGGPPRLPLDEVRLLRRRSRSPLLQMYHKLGCGDGLRV